MLFDRKEWEMYYPDKTAEQCLQDERLYLKVIVGENRRQLPCSCPEDETSYESAMLEFFLEKKNEVVRESGIIFKFLSNLRELLGLKINDTSFIGIFFKLISKPINILNSYMENISYYVVNNSFISKIWSVCVNCTDLQFMVSLSIGGCLYFAYNNRVYLKRNIIRFLESKIIIQLKWFWYGVVHFVQHLQTNLFVRRMKWLWFEMQFFRTNYFIFYLIRDDIDFYDQFTNIIYNN